MLFDMNIEQIISEIDREISKLQQAKVLIEEAVAPTRKGPGRPKRGAAPISTLTAAQKARWAKAKKAASK
jgi:hypothetical protein